MGEGVPRSIFSARIGPTLKLVTRNALTDDILNALGEEFSQRLRSGERPSIADYAGRYSGDEADEVAAFLESIAMLEDMKQGAASPSVERTARSLPEMFGRYRIERPLGEGGMGTVYLAQDTHLHRKVALKIPKFAGEADDAYVERFHREARSAATLHHPNICPIHDIGEHDGVHFISMAYISGRPLSTFVTADRPPSIVGVLRVVRKVALALDEAHQRGIVHRDLKPANIMIDRFHEPIIMDFGLARQLDDDAEDVAPLASGDPSSLDTSTIETRLTRHGLLVGSPGYMSPEQMSGRGAAVGPASDIYSLGVLLYELLTGELPFQGASLISLVAAVMTQPPPDASKVRPAVDPRLAAICNKAMAKRPEDRYASMRAMADALGDLKRSIEASERSRPSVEANVPLATRPRRRLAVPWPAAVAGGGIVLGSVFALAFAMMRAPGGDANASNLTAAPSTIAPIVEESSEEHGVEEATGNAEDADETWTFAPLGRRGFGGAVMRERLNDGSPRPHPMQRWKGRPEGSPIDRFLEQLEKEEGERPTAD